MVTTCGDCSHASGSPTGGSYFAVVAAVYFAAITVYASAETGEIIEVRQARAQISMLAYLFLVFYLSWPMLQRRLKNFYLPIAIAIATAAPAASSLATTTSARGVFPVLFIPLVLIGWQYNFRGVLAFTVAAAVVDMLLILRQVGAVSLDTLPVFAASSATSSPSSWTHSGPSVAPSCAPTCS